MQGYADYVQDGWYPGDNCVDILGSDTYKFGLHKAAWERCLTLTDKRLPCAFHECGEIPDPDELATKRPGWLWFLTWHTIWLTEKNTPEYLHHMFNYSYTLTLTM